MATCQFCGRQFTHTQAVRAHLKACSAYQERDQVASSALGRVALGTEPEAPSAEAKFTDDREDQREAARERAQERADREARRQLDSFLRRAEAERQAHQRREMIQSVKDQTVGWSWQHPTIPPT